MSSEQVARGANWNSVRSFGILAVSLGVVHCVMMASFLAVVSPTQTDRVLFTNSSAHVNNPEPRRVANVTEADKLDIAKGLGELSQHAKSYTANTTTDPIVAYSICRQDRPGSAITDMLYAHATAFAHHMTYAGACCMNSAFPRKETVHLLDQLRLDHFLPFACPDGVGPHRSNLSRPNATELLSPLILNPKVYRAEIEHHHFTAAWRESIQTSMAEQSDLAVAANLPPDRPFKIAVHIRRGDVSPCRYKRRYLPNAHFLELIDQYTPISSDENNRPVHVTIYSESQSFESFDEFRARNYTVELDTKDLAVVWKALATADVAILSRSFFSFVPATVNPNTVVATPFFGFVPLDGWKEASDELIKSSDKLTEQISRERCNRTNTVQA